MEHEEHQQHCVEDVIQGSVVELPEFQVINDIIATQEVNYQEEVNEVKEIKEATTSNQTWRSL